LSGLRLSRVGLMCVDASTPGRKGAEAAGAGVEAAHPARAPVPTPGTHACRSTNAPARACVVRRDRGKGQGRLGRCRRSSCAAAPRCTAPVTLRARQRGPHPAHVDSAVTRARADDGRPVGGRLGACRMPRALRVPRGLCGRQSMQQADVNESTRSHDLMGTRVSQCLPHPPRNAPPRPRNRQPRPPLPSPAPPPPAPPCPPTTARAAWRGRAPGWRWLRWRWLRTRPHSLSR